jgi:hypothetical protein
MLSFLWGLFFRKQPSYLKMIELWVNDLRSGEAFIVEVSKEGTVVQTKILNPDEIFLRSPGRR